MLRKGTSTIGFPQRRNDNKAEANGPATWIKLVRWLPWSNKILTGGPDERKYTGVDKNTSFGIRHSAVPQSSQEQLHGDQPEDLDSGEICIKSLKALDMSIQDSSRLSRRLSHCRTELNFVKSQQGYEIQKAQSKLQFLHESINTIAMSSLAQAQALSDQSNSDTASSISQLTDDWKEFLDQWKVLVDFQTAVNTKQKQVDRFQSKVLSAVRMLLVQLPGGTAAVHKPEALDGVDTVSTVSETVPETARRLFEKSGHLAALEEQLQGLEANHFDEQQQRELIRDQDGEPNIPDAEFEARYEVECRIVKADIDKMHAEMQSLRLQCEQENIDLSRFGAQPTNIPLTADAERTLEHDDEYDSGAAILDPDDRRSETDGHKSVSAVEDWLEEVGSDGESTA